jgi:hypothetical protein
MAVYSTRGAPTDTDCSLELTLAVCSTREAPTDTDFVVWS